MAKEPENEDVLLEAELDGVQYVVTVPSLTFGEMAEVEDFVGTPFDRMPMDAAKTMMGLFYIAKKRKNPDTTFADLADIKIGDIKAVKKAPGPKSKASDPKTPENSGNQD